MTNVKFPFALSISALIVSVIAIITSIVLLMSNDSADEEPVVVSNETLPAGQVVVNEPKAPIQVVEPNLPVTEEQLTHTSDELGIIFSYPLSWHLRTETIATNKGTGEQIYVEPPTSEPFTNYFVVYPLDSLTDPSVDTLEEWRDVRLAINEETDARGYGTEVTARDISIGGEKAILIASVQIAADGTLFAIPDTSVLVEHRGQVIEIIFNANSPEAASIFDSLSLI